MKKTILLKNEEQKSLKDVADFLRQLADKLDGNEIKLRQGEQEVALTVPNLVTFEVEVEEKPKKQGTQRTLEIEIEWLEGQAGGPVTIE